MTSNGGKRKAIVPADIFDGLKISAGARSLFYHLCGFADRAGECFPGQTRLARDLAVNVRTIQNRLNELEAAGLLERVREPNRRFRYRVIRDRAEVNGTRLSNQLIASERREKFGQYAKRGVARRHPNSAKVKKGSPVPETNFTSDVKKDSPKQNQEQFHLNTGTNTNQLSNGGASTGNLIPDSSPSNEPCLTQQINWIGWVHWLGKLTGRDTEQCWAEIFAQLDLVGGELGVSTHEAEMVLDRFLKIMRRAFPTSPSLAELLMREKRKLEGKS